MKWEDLKRSSNVEDLRYRGSGGRMNLGSGRGANLLIPIIRFLMGSTIGRIVLVIGAVAYFMGYNPLALLDAQNQTRTNAVVSQSDDERSAQFVAAILGQTEEIWTKIFEQNGMSYPKPKLVLFRGSVKSGCGYADAQVGPFYCPVDKKVYLDLSFFDELSQRHNAPGDFAQAYVIAHEIGHHVQNQLGILDKAHRAQQSDMGKAKANATQVKVELQADCYAGVWAYHTQKERAVLEEGDIEEALNAASQIGDDTLQKQAQGYVVPDAFTHGTSAQRMKWFKRGFAKGTLEGCNTGV
ncbi:MAG: zinc metallopeptidase [Sulfuricurvum sp.]|uniref:KPN_02809 family neutral zinc metallopeptidase n=1 Tax=Sulfuricurvum sp. TaxID=2025608 RepID=UPI002607F7FC|nr:neutral zinc metallopeptidase [Sulfuricurvum sp.]MDD2828120.1 zinc metallopeptidase [Sulfuricurvum sp.]MDD4948006.1 zinc metallopeptidase [Sulfuricurvum sp.]